MPSLPQAFGDFGGIMQRLAYVLAVQIKNDLRLSSSCTEILLIVNTTVSTPIGGINSMHYMAVEQGQSATCST
jgi:hypothetical protein